MSKSKIVLDTFEHCFISHLQSQYNTEKIMLHILIILENLILTFIIRFFVGWLNGILHAIIFSSVC